MLKPEVTIECLKVLGREFLPGYLGIEVFALAEGEARGCLAVERHHFAPNGYVHAASVVALADTTCGYATLAHLPPGATSFTTLELKSNHLGSVKGGRIVCHATAQHLGRSTQVWDAVVSDETSGRTLALFRCTQMILWPRNEAA